MYTLLTLISGASIGLAVILIAKLLINIKGSNLAYWLSLCSLSALCYMLKPYVTESLSLFNLIIIFAPHFTAVAILGLAKSIFEEKTKLSLNEWLISVIYLGLNFYRSLRDYIDLPLILNEIIDFYIIFVLSQILKIIIILIAIFFTFNNINFDLVESRRKFRYIFVLIISSYLIFFLITQLVFLYNFPYWLKLTHEILTLGIWLLLHLWLFRLNSQEIQNLSGHCVSEKEKNIPATTKLFNKQIKDSNSFDSDQKLLNQLEDLMVNKKVYRQAGLTISELAKLVGTQEYLLRKLINQHLGYRNFNSYLNQYRITEAKDILSDEHKASLSILSVSLDIGFNSLAPFNKAFKAETGYSPRDFRKINLARRC